MAAMKSTKCKTAKAERRAHRKARRNGRASDLTLTPLGGTMEPALADQILAAFRGFDPTGPWSSIAPRILPVLKRRHHPYPAEAAPLHIHVPPGVWTGFGIDLGPAFSHVSQTLLDGWHIDHATLLGTALENLAALVDREPPVVDSFPVNGIEITAVQGQGWGSSLILAPELLGPILGPEPRLLLTPVRNTLLALPDEVDDDMAFEMWAAIADGAHDELEVDPLRWTGSTVALIGDPALGLPN
jgi:hypothetical protein